MDAATAEAVRYMNEACSGMSEYTIHFVQTMTLKALGDLP